MNNFIKVWWHCLLRISNGHRMVKFTYHDSGIHWVCDYCGYCDDKRHWKHLKNN